MNQLPERIRIKDIARLADVSVGTVDRVIHGRSGVSETSKQRVEEILKQLDYQPNMYASALASNKKYLFICLLPTHQPGEYWTDVEKGIHNAVRNFSDFNITVDIHYYDPFDYHSFTAEGEKITTEQPDGVILAPTAKEYTRSLTERLDELSTPYIYIDSNLPELPPLAFFGQHSQRSGYFAAKMLMLLTQNPKEVVIFRKINEGTVGSNQQENREIGFRAYMKEHHPDCQISDLDLHAKRPDEDHAMLDQFFAEHPKVTSGITFNSKAYIIGEYLKERNKADFGLIGYDLLERNVTSLKEGNICFLIAQQPEVQGFNSVKYLCDHLIFKKEVHCINYMPIDLLTAETIDFYKDK